MPEDTPTCRIHEKYSHIECANQALPEDPDGLCILHSQDKKKDPTAFRQAILGIWTSWGLKHHDFRAVFFPGPFDPQEYFGTQELNKTIDFSWATFTGRVNFSRVTFKERVNFLKATFMEDIVFTAATFMKEANFTLSNFTKWASFFDTTFTERADFSGAIFTKEAFFHAAIFTKESVFSKATFEERAEFSGARIKGTMIFRSINWRDDRGLPPVFQGEFRHLELTSRAVLRFQDLSLAQVSFQGTDLRRVEFHHVQWHPYPGRQAVYDEVLLRQEEKQSPWFWNGLLYDEPHAGPPSYWTNKYGEVERFYRDLQENYEKVRDYKKMGDFHYGEMEMHRRAAKWRWFPLYWYNLYWTLNGYGERPSRLYAF